MSVDTGTITGMPRFFGKHKRGSRIKVSPKHERTVDGQTFDSKGEMRRYLVLKQRFQMGLIDSLVLQPKYEIRIGGKKVCAYSADFAYWDRDQGKQVVEDFKGMKTAMYRLKKKLVEATWPNVRIKEVKNPEEL